MPAPPTLTVISLGGGVQPSVMALMASQGAFDRTPDCATFADGRPALTPPPIAVSWGGRKLTRRCANTPGRGAT
jgi:hypothetical protein